MRLSVVLVLLGAVAVLVRAGDGHRDADSDDEKANKLVEADMSLKQPITSHAAQQNEASPIPSSTTVAHVSKRSYKRMKALVLTFTVCFLMLTALHAFLLYKYVTRSRQNKKKRQEKGGMRVSSRTMVIQNSPPN